MHPKRYTFEIDDHFTTLRTNNPIGVAFHALRGKYRFQTTPGVTSYCQDYILTNDAGETVCKITELI
jgi:hypothetical protein